MGQLRYQQKPKRLRELTATTEDSAIRNKNGVLGFGLGRCGVDSKSGHRLRLRLFWLKMDSEKQFTSCRVFGCTWKIWSNEKLFPLTVKYPLHTRKSFYTFILPSNHFHSPQKISLLTHTKPKPKDKESYRQ